MGQFVYTFFLGGATVVAVVLISGVVIVSCWAATAFCVSAWQLIDKKVPALPERIWMARMPTINVHQKKGKKHGAKKLGPRVGKVARLGDGLHIKQVAKRSATNDRAIQP